MNTVFIILARLAIEDSNQASNQVVGFELALPRPVSEIRDVQVEHRKVRQTFWRIVWLHFDLIANSDAKDLQPPSESSLEMAI